MIEVIWDVESAPCLIAEASGVLAESVIEIQIHRAGDPLGDCASVRVAYHYVARTQAVAPGRYDVRVIDATLGLSPREVGRRSVVVTAGAAG